MADVRACLQACDPQLLDVCRDSETSDSVDASRMVVFLTDGRRVQKVLWRQLFVLDSMMSLMEELKSARQLLTQPCPAPPGGGARGRWKALKLQYRAALEETENLLQTQLQKIQEITEKRQRIEELVQKIQTQAGQKEALLDSLLVSQKALQQSEAQLQRLQDEAQITASHMIDWEQIRDDLQMELSLVQEGMNMKLLSLSPSEISLELSPGPAPGPAPGPDPGPDPGSDLSPDPGLDLAPLRISVLFGPDDTFTLQTGEDLCLLDCCSGSVADLRSVLLELLQRYGGQAELLTEIQSLRSCFAIDWRASQRHLLFLKSAAEVYELQVEDGYPHSGTVRLLAGPWAGLQNQEKKLSLTQWLLLLSSDPEPGLNQD